jgi:hypothetical protein
MRRKCVARTSDGFCLEGASERGRGEENIGASERGGKSDFDDGKGNRVQTVRVSD